MNITDSYDNLFSKLSGIEQALSSAASAFSSIGKLYPFDYADKFANALNAIPKSAILQAEQINRIFDSPAILSQLHQFEQCELMLPQLADGVFESALNAINSSAFQTTLAQIDAIGNSAIFENNPVLLRLSETLEAYQSAPLLRQMEQALSHIPAIDPELFEFAKKIDWSDFRFCEDGSITFDGTTYAPEKLSDELATQINDVKSGAVSLREKFENLKKRLWLLLLILQLIAFLPEVPTAVEFYGTIASQIEEVIQQKSQICFTIRDTSYLRESANSSAKTILLISYDTPLEIINTIPRWYQVKYSDAEDKTTIGWISKISVEIGE